MTTEKELQYIAEVEETTESTEGTDEGAAVRVEQIDAYMPYITLYYYADNADMPPAYNQVRGVLETQEQPLKVNYSRTFQDNRTGIHYYIIVDTTMGKSNLNDTRDMLNEFQNWMKAGDTLTVYTIGDTTVRLIDRADNEQDLEAEIQTIAGSYSGMNYAGALSEIWTDIQELESASEQVTSGRQILISVTPEIEWTGDSIGEQQAATSLRQSGLPLYEMIMGGEGTKTVYQTLAEDTGGTVSYPERGELGRQVEQLCRQINRCYVVQFQADSNRVTDSWQMLSLTLDEDETEVQLPIWVSRYQEDDVAPEICLAEVTDDRMIHITFSEMVYGADENSHYQITDEKGKPLTVDEITCEVNAEGESNGADILLDQKLYKGSYTIRTSGIVDASMEENVLTDEYVMEYADGPGGMVRVLDQCKTYWWIGAVLILIAGIVIVWKQICRRQQNQKVAVQVHNARTLVGQKTESLQPAAYQYIKLIIYRNGKNIDTQQVAVDGSLIIGRSDLSDLYFEDDQLSRQHFAIECIQGELFVEDLDTTNGTWLNGKRIQKKEKLCSQDRIGAGMLEFVIRW